MSNASFGVGSCFYLKEQSLGLPLGPHRISAVQQGHDGVTLYFEVDWRYKIDADELYDLLGA